MKKEKAFKYHVSRTWSVDFPDNGTSIDINVSNSTSEVELEDAIEVSPNVFRTDYGSNPNCSDWEEGIVFASSKNDAEQIMWDFLSE